MKQIIHVEDLTTYNIHYRYQDTHFFSTKILINR